MSPNSFFQINTKGAEKLYSIVSDFCTSSLNNNDAENNSSDEKVSIVDVCCGTIGICVTSKLGNKVNKLIGVEMCEAAVEDAIENAKYNKIANAEFVI